MKALPVPSGERPRATMGEMADREYPQLSSYRSVLLSLNAFLVGLRVSEEPILPQEARKAEARFEIGRRLIRRGAVFANGDYRRAHPEDIALSREFQDLLGLKGEEAQSWAERADRTLLRVQDGEWEGLSEEDRTFAETDLETFALRVGGFER